MTASTLRPLALACFAALAIAACKPQAAQETATTPGESQPAVSYAQAHAGDYAVVPLKADLSHLDENTQRMVAKLEQAADIMN